LRLTELHMSALSEMHRKTATPILLEHGEFYAGLKRRVDWLETKVNHTVYSIFKASLARVLSHIGHTDIPHGVCHRDFTPWNTKVVNDTLYVFDWEWSLLEAPPFIDLFHFLTTVHIFINQYDAEQIVERLFHEDTNVIIRYAKEIGVDDPDLWTFFLILYLVDILTFYSEADVLEAKKDSFVNREYRVRFEVLKMLIQSPDSQSWSIS
jgi:thiamine kinase-like enzyme